ncbi:MAG: tetratricopeptide repeat protein [Dermatophilaceae bacterium]
MSPRRANPWLALVNDTIRWRDFVDYRRSFEVARAAQVVLEELTAHIDEHGATGADVIAPAAKRLTLRLQQITLHADDSSGSIGGACQDALDLYALCCREGSPDSVKLARWIVKAREDSPGWPNITLEPFAPAFTAEAWDAYRAAVADLDGRTEPGQYGIDRFEVERMILELLDHDGDVDGAIRLLSDRERPRFGGIIRRLLAADRTEEAMDWLDRAVAAGRVWHQDDDYHLSFGTAADLYAQAGRVEEAFAVLRAGFRRHAGPGAYRALVDFAAGHGRGESERAWAVEEATRQARLVDGSALVGIHLAAGDEESAWTAARDFGAGVRWSELAERFRTSHPDRAGELYAMQLPGLLSVAKTRAYPGIARHLVEMERLYAAAGRTDEFRSLMAELRSTYARRTSFIKALDKRALP